LLALIALLFVVFGPLTFAIAAFFKAKTSERQSNEAERSLRVRPESS
jgi:hypothetical protein